MKNFTRIKAKTKVTLTLVLFCATLLTCGLFSAPAKANIGPVSFDKYTYFGFTNGWLNFNETQVFTLNLTGNTWSFDSYSVLLDGANCTIQDWFDGNLTTTLYLTSISGGTCTFILNMGDTYSALFKEVIGASNYLFDRNLDLLTITKTGFSVTVIYINWNPVPPSGPPPGNGNPPPTNNTNPVPPNNGSNPIPTNPSNNTSPVIPNGPGIILTSPFAPDLILLGVMLILIVVGIVGYYSGKNKRNPVNQARKQWDRQNKSKRTKWKRETD